MSAWYRSFFFSCLLHSLPFFFLILLLPGKPSNYQIKYISLGSILNFSEVSFMDHDYGSGVHEDSFLSNNQVNWSFLPRGFHVERPMSPLFSLRGKENDLPLFLGIPVVLHDEDAQDGDIPSAPVMDLKLEKP